MFSLGILLIALIGRVFYLSVDKSAVMASSDHSREKKITITDNRGVIYDRNLKKISPNKEVILGVIDPLLITDKNALFENTAELTKEEFDKKIELQSPFTAVLKADLSVPGVTTFKVNTPPASDILAVHTIGYLDDSKNGVCGIQKAYNDLLKSDSPLTVTFPVDAVRRAISGLGAKFEGNYEASDSGVMLTIDSELQEICDSVTKKYIKNGATVILDVKSGEIVAMTSTPSLDTADLSASIKTEGAFVNKCLTPFNVGSAFKICDTAVYLENGGSIYDTKVCKGGKMVAGRYISCMDSHQKLDLISAFSKSCNTYFIDIMQNRQTELLTLAKSLGFGTANTLAPGLVSKQGSLPTEKSLTSSIALANFSIGQGDFMATPLQLASLVQTIANDGVYKKPTLVIGKTQKGKLISRENAVEEKQIISTKTAKEIKDIMINTAYNGTARMALPDKIGAGAKTSTAETGILKDGKLIKQGWLVGFFPATSPKYAVAVLSENALGGARSCGPCFKDIANANA
ncbi:MAG: penicillin-binding transpeptidase domain-containing protein, partial [Clostridia bacterium]